MGHENLTLNFDLFSVRLHMFSVMTTETVSKRKSAAALNQKSVFIDAHALKKLTR